MISASGHPGISLVVGAITLGASAVLNALLIPAYGLVGAATATTVSMLAGAIGACVYVRKKLGALISLSSAARIAGSAGAVYAASLLFSPSSNLLIVAKLIGLSVFYLAALIISGEVGRRDVQVLAQVVRVRR